MRKIIKLFLLAILTGCGNTAINNVVKNDKTITNTDKKDLKPLLPSASPKSTEQIKNELISNNSDKPKFDNAKVVKEGIRDSYIYLIFKDEYKVRIKGLEEKTFKSLISKDLSQINNLLTKYNVKQVEPHNSFFSKSEEELEAEEKAAEKLYGTDYPNKGSIYTLSVENVDVKSFIEELRKNELVLSANENTG